MYELRNLTKIYPKNKDSSPVVALSSVSFTLPDVGFVFILGKSGSGKSTLLNILGGLDAPTDGELLFNGQSLNGFSKQDFDNYRNTCVGFVFQDFCLINEFSVSQNIGFALELQGKKADKKAISDVLSAVGLAGYENRAISTLSGGQKQRVAIARALIKNPTMILADEPTGSLDSETGNGVLAALKELSKTRLVVAVSHDRESADKFADIEIELKDGKISGMKELSKEKDAEASPLTNYTTKKSKMPISKGFKIGASGIAHKPLRAVASTFLSALAFSFFGLISTLLLFNENQARSNVALKMHASSDLFQKTAKYSVISSEYDYASRTITETRKNEYEERAMLSDAELESLNVNSSSGLNFVGVYGKGLYDFLIEDGPNFIYPYDPNPLHSVNYFSGFADFDSSTLKKSGVELIEGSAPTQANEIVLSSYHANMCVGSIGLTDLNELIGKRIKIPFDGANVPDELTYFSICGIVDTGPIDNYYVERFEEANAGKNRDLLEKFGDYIKGSFHGLAYVSPSFFENFGKLFYVDPHSEMCKKELTSFYGLRLSTTEPSESSESDRVDIILPDFTDTGQFSFYDTSGSPMVYRNPLDKEIYIDGDYYRRGALKDKQSIIYSILTCIQYAHEEGYLPEANDYFASDANEQVFNQLLDYSSNLDRENFYKIIENDYFSERINGLIAAFSKKAFQRTYIRECLIEMTSMNVLGGFGIPDLDSTSTFYRDIGHQIEYPVDCEDFGVFEDCYNYILNNNALLSFANKAIHVGNYSYGFGTWETDAAYSEIKGKINGREGKEIDQSVWNTFEKGFVEACRNNSTLESFGYRCSAQNLISLDYSYAEPSSEITITYPKEIYYRSSKGNIGKLSVIGHFFFDGKTSVSDPEAFIASENFLNRVGKAPKFVYSTVIETEYEPVENPKYNYVITKSSFSVAQVSEICKKGKGYEYKFTNSAMHSVDNLISQFHYYYFIFIICGALMGAFAILLHMTFIASSIEYKKREIGIIRCLGGRNIDIFKIFASESFCISVTSTILSTVFSIIGCTLINNLVARAISNASLLSFGPLNFLVIVGISIIFSAIATLLPLLRRWNMQPSEALRRE